MLPLIELRLSDLCTFGIDVWHGVVERPLTCTYTFNAEELKQAILSTNENVDRFLTKCIVDKLYTKPCRSKMIFYYSISQNTVSISFSSRKGSIRCDWLSKIPGYMEQGHLYLAQNGVPFIFWDGANAHRIYEQPMNYDPSELYCVDFGNIFGIAIDIVDKEMYSTIRSSPSTYYDYSLLPKETQEVLNISGKKYLLYHSLFSFVDDNQKDDEWSLDEWSDEIC